MWCVECCKNDACSGARQHSLYSRLFSSSVSHHALKDAAYIYSKTRFREKTLMRRRGSRPRSPKIVLSLNTGVMCVVRLGGSSPGWRCTLRSGGPTIWRFKGAATGQGQPSGKLFRPTMAIGADGFRCRGFGIGVDKFLCHAQAVPQEVIAHARVLTLG